MHSNTDFLVTLEISLLNFSELALYTAALGTLSWLIYYNKELLLQITI